MLNCGSNKTNSYLLPNNSCSCLSDSFDCPFSALSVNTLAWHLKGLLLDLLELLSRQGAGEHRLVNLVWVPGYHLLETCGRQNQLWS